MDCKQVPHGWCTLSEDWCRVSPTDPRAGHWKLSRSMLSLVRLDHCTEVSALCAGGAS